MNRYEYHVVESVCEALGVTTYGISFWRRQAGGNLEVCSVKDISSDREAVLQLAERCQRAQLSFMHLMDVIEDFLP